MAKYINLCSIEDYCFTSTNGVLLQVFCDMRNLSITEKELAPKIKEIFDSTLDSPSQKIDFDFSIRLAKHLNPLIDIDAIKKLNIARKN